MKVVKRIFLTAWLAVIAFSWGLFLYPRVNCWLSEDCAGYRFGGGYWCGRCYTSATGTDRKFHTVWYNVNRGYSPICEVCWHKTSPKEKIKYFRSDDAPWMNQAVVEDWQHEDWYRALHRKAVAEGRR